MILGLGTSSTAKHVVDRIGELLRQGKLTNIVGIPTSKIAQEQSLSLGIPLSDLDNHPVIDLAIDGADEVDLYMNLVKGRGDSLLREKMVEGACKKFVCVIQKLTGAKNVKIKTTIGSSLVAGFTIRYGKSGSKLIDMSVKEN